MQLDALLDSMRANLKLDPIDAAPTVIWLATTDAYDEGYQRCFAEHDWVDWIREYDFQHNYESLLPASGYVCHFVDDDIVHRPVNLAHAAFEMDRDDRLLAFSLRLGTECTRCYSLNQPQRLPITSRVQPPMMSWRWAGCDGDFNYGMSLDGHVLRADDVWPMIEGHDFANPNELESLLAQRVRLRSTIRPKMASYGKACVTGVPANRVNVTHPNRCMDGYDPVALNEAYLDGVRIAWREMDWAAVDGAHAEIPYAFSNLADKEAA